MKTAQRVAFKNNERDEPPGLWGDISAARVALCPATSRAYGDVESSAKPRGVRAPLRQGLS